MNKIVSTFTIIQVVLFTIAWLGFYCVISPFTFAQNAEVKPAESTATEAEETKEVEETRPSVISVENIQNKLTEVNLRLSEIENSLNDKTVIENVKKSIPQFRQELLMLKTQFKAVTLGKFGLTEIMEMHSEFTHFNGKLSTKAGHIKKEVSKLNSWFNEVQQWRKLLERTLASAEQEQAPQELMDDMLTTLQYIIAVEEQVVERRNEMLTIVGKISEEEESVQVILKEIKKLQSEIKKLFLVQQGEPLWRIRFTFEEFQTSLNVFFQDIYFRIKETKEYGSNQPFRFLLYGLFSIVMLSLTYWSRTQLKKQDTSGKDIEKVISPLNNMAFPLTYGLLLTFTIIFSISAIWVDVPYGFRMGLFFLMMILWLFVLSKEFSRGLRVPVLGLAALSVLTIVHGSPRDLKLINHLILTVELVLSLAGALWILWSGYINKLGVFFEKKLWLGVLKWWHLLNIALSAVGLAAALSGYLILADRLARLAILGSVLGTSLMICSRIIERIVKSAVFAGLLDSVNIIKNNRELFLLLLFQVIRTLLFCTFIYLYLMHATLWSTFQKMVGDILSAELGVGTFNFSLASLLAFGLTLWFSWMAARFVSFTLNEEVFTRLSTAPGVPLAISTFSRYVILTFGFIIAMTTMGFSLDRITLAISALGVGIGFGLQNVVNNFVSGVILLFERPIRVGDLVQINELVGTVTKIGLRTSKIRTLDGADIIMPNGEFTSAQVTNWTLSDRKRRIIIPVGVAYGTNLRKVLEILLTIARSHPKVLKNPAPTALFRAFGSSSLDFELRAWTGNIDERYTIMSEIGVAVSEALEKEGIVIPFPQRDLHLKTVTHELGNVLAEARKTEQKEKPESKYKPAAKGGMFRKDYE